ncbi:hypothetical protein BD311DRAFT_750751 [Dichomitus squalens]|uniref:Secreted protein n=1 Tax=Dichomitus squalens TaxID=114155 RepID=A0A4Q9MY27_9APHY|nr:hypothetical protein BD311DRAFT_750751 [Dichomitus squalens]
MQDSEFALTLFLVHLSVCVAMMPGPGDRGLLRYSSSCCLQSRINVVDRWGSTVDDQSPETRIPRRLVPRNSGAR